MTMPGFSAESALRGAGVRYPSHTRSMASAAQVIAADFVDQNCLSGCLQNCGFACAGTAGQGKAACIRQCAADNAECRASCRRPGNPPGGGGSGGGGSGGGGAGGSVCDPGATLCPDGRCCPPGFPNCIPGAGLCCPPGLTHVVTIFGNTICVP